MEAVPHDQLALGASDSAKVENYHERHNKYPSLFTVFFISRGNITGVHSVKSMMVIWYSGDARFATTLEKNEKEHA